MTTTKNNEHKKLNFSSERDQSQACLNSAEHEKNQGRKVLNVPNKQEQNQTCLDSAEREGLRPKGNVPNLRFPEFQGEWKEYRIEDITENISSGRCKSHSSSGKYNLYGSTGIIGKTNEACYEGNLVLVARVGANAGSLQILNEPCGITDNTLIIKPKEVDVQYIYYFLQHFNLNRLIFGSGQPLITGGMLKKVKVSLGTIQEQNKITRLLSVLDERIATQNKIIDKLQTLIKGISSRIFASIQGIEYRMGDIVTITNGNSNVQDAVTQSKDGLYPFFDRSEDIKYLPTFLFDKEAIIYPGEGTEFMPRYFKGKFALHQRCYAIFDFNEIINARFLYFYLKTRNSYFVKNAVGSTVPSLRLDTFQKIKVIIPPKKIQHSVSLCLSSMEQKCNVEKKILHKLLKQKQYLLRQMFI